MNSADDHSRHDDRELTARGLNAYGRSKGGYAVQQLALDARDVAETVAGRRLLRWLISSARDATAGCHFDTRDYFNLGRRSSCEDLEAALRRLLPREAFLEIVYPEKEKE